MAEQPGQRGLADKVVEHFEKRTRIHASAKRLWEWHASPGALELLTPPWETVTVLDAGQGIADASRVVLRVGRFPLRQRWVAEHRDVHPGKEFTDVQIAGPFRHWEHRHVFEPDGEDASILVDLIAYALPGGRMGAFFGGPFVRRKLEKMFTWRHAATRQALESGVAS